MLHTLCSFSQALSHPPTNPLQPNPHHINGWKPFLSLKPLHAGRWFISYEWRAQTKVHSWLSPAAGCLVSSCQTLVFYIHVPHRGIRSGIWLRVKRRRRTRRTWTTKKRGLGGNVAAPPEVDLKCRLGQRRNWSWCQGEGSEPRANACRDGSEIDFVISNKFYMSPCIISSFDTKMAIALRHVQSTASITWCREQRFQIKSAGKTFSCYSLKNKQLSWKDPCCCEISPCLFRDGICCKSVQWELGSGVSQAARRRQAWGRKACGARKSFSISLSASS